MISISSALRVQFDERLIESDSEKDVSVIHEMVIIRTFVGNTAFLNQIGKASLPCSGNWKPVGWGEENEPQPVTVFSESRRLAYRHNFCFSQKC